MKKEVQDALKALSGPQKLLTGPSENVIIVYKRDLQTLIDWVEEREGVRKKGFALKDKVELVVPIFGVPAGTKGFIHQVLHPSDHHDFVFVYKAQGLRYPLRVEAKEIRKVKEDGM